MRGSVAIAREGLVKPERQRTKGGVFIHNRIRRILAKEQWRPRVHESARPSVCAGVLVRVTVALSLVLTRPHVSAPGVHVADTWRTRGPALPWPCPPRIGSPVRRRSPFSFVALRLPRRQPDVSGRPAGGLVNMSLATCKEFSALAPHVKRQEKSVAHLRASQRHEPSNAALASLRPSSRAAPAPANHTVNQPRPSVGWPAKRTRATQRDAVDPSHNFRPARGQHSRESRSRRGECRNESAIGGYFVGCIGSLGGFPGNHEQHADR